ncbi:hypothetical protein BDK51DRAFT_30426 [Blyttiomyces helicus]|uniref:Endonuclease lcl3 n=1 Tax=Blyttiomyces helicus TaxID=388810 RepID=A0A4V1IQX6_9FUNG|nr:hypothetical protein BDK51DRAFT_30426 [Blyttiomyces helicus]|eukprot:RKO88087.1 hypothetical protein BDK51DRAFT_30426 [Blyttiomyces helicus]
MAALPSSGRAFVKSVLSGDTVVLRGKPTSGPPPPKRLGTQKDPEKEEPFAFESREYLRRLLIGKEVAYKTEYTTSSNSRDFGVLIVQHPVNGETNITRLLVKEGWVKVKTPEGKRAPTEEQISLSELSEQAQAAKKGLWADKDAGGSTGVRKVEHNVSDARGFLEKYKGKPIEAILEQVRDGTTHRVCLLLPENNGKVHQYITLMLSGLKAPTYRKDVPNVEDLIEEYGAEAKYFVESRLLQRDVKVLLEGLSSNDNFVGSIQFPLGNIAEALLAEGLAKVVDWNIALVTGGPAKYRAAELRAKEKKLRLWKSWVGKAKVGGPESEFDGIVTRIMSGDTVFVESVHTGKERKLTLSSIRAAKGPEKKPAAPSKDGKDAVKEYGLDFDAKEFLRTRYIGKQVHVLIDYVKPADAGFESRECATISDQSGKNIAELLVARGLADVLRHRRDDDNRSSQYDQLLLAADRALKAQKGIHSPKEPPTHRISDASVNANKARQFLPFLQRSGAVSGHVDFVSSGSRFRIHVPKENCTLTLVLGGIRCPRNGRPGEKSEPFGPEAFAFANRRIMQRDVEFTVEGQDKTGGFIGALFVTVDGEKTNVAVMLLNEGLASVHDYTASQSQHANQLYEAQRRAKDARKGMWKDWKPEDDEEVVEEKVDLDRPIETKDVIVSHIEDAGVVFLQIVGPELNKLERLMSDFAKHHAEPGSQPIAPFTPRNGEYCSAKFTADDAWYRARVKKVHADRTYTVHYIDYGNTETLPAARLRPLPPTFATTTLPAQATESKLAHIKIPSLDDDYGVEAFEALRDLTEGVSLQARILGRGSVLSVLLVRPGKDESINERILRDGFAMVEKAIVARWNAEQKAARVAGAGWAGAGKGKKDLIGGLIEAQEDAKKGRVAMWRYGDITEDD